MLAIVLSFRILKVRLVLCTQKHYLKTFTTLNFNPLLRGGGGGAPLPFDLSYTISEEVS